MDQRQVSRGLGLSTGSSSRSGGPPRTGVRGALRTGQRDAASYEGVGMNTKITMESRPVTQQGLRGLRPGTTGPGRQVRDTSYYISLVRQKSKELQSEIKRLRDETARFESDNISYGESTGTGEKAVRAGT